jgi:hypothetical protein
MFVDGEAKLSNLNLRGGAGRAASARPPSRVHVRYAQRKRADVSRCWILIHTSCIRCYYHRAANVALQMWPVWFGGVNFGDLTKDTAGRTAIEHLLHLHISRLAGTSEAWATAAVACALEDKRPRVVASVVPRGLDTAESRPDATRADST